MTVSELRIIDESVFRDLSHLMSELNGNILLKRDALQYMMDDQNCHLYVINVDGHMVACACLCVYHQPFQTDGTVEAVVVSSEYRGRGFGRQLMEHILDEAARMGIDELHLTSRPSRKAANALYQHVGFKCKETNCYVLPIGQSH